MTRNIVPTFLAYRLVTSALLMVVAFWPSTLFAQTPSQPSIRAIFTDEAPRIDGELDEAIWQSITPTTGFRQRKPAVGQAASEKSEIRIAYDADNLYFGLTFYDREPGKIRANIFDRGGRIDKDDNIEIAIDSYYDRRNAYIFEINPLGTQDDALVTDESEINWDWDGVYFSEGKITEYGWVLEVRIPFKTLRFSKDDTPLMGVAIKRLINRKNEEVTWPFISENYPRGIWTASQYARLEGLENLNRGNNIQIKPYLLGGGQKITTGDDPGSEFVRDAGLDVKYGITSNLTLDLTYNTDFAQVEADAVQINLSRFNLFFPEKREFFLERNGLFQFGNSRETELFFSRRIGITNDILGGARVTGQAGPLSIGLLNIQTRDDGDVSGQNFSAARVRADVLSRTTVGAIFTNVQDESIYNRAAGADVETRFWGSSSFKSWATRVWDESTGETKDAASADLTIQNDLYGLELGYLTIEPGFRPGLGFVRRTDQKRYRAEGRYEPYISRTGEKAFRRLRFTGEGTYITGIDNDLQSTEVRATALAFLVGRDFFGVSARRIFENLEQPFNIRTQTQIPAGEYTWYDLLILGGSDASRPVYISSHISLGEFYTGTLQGYQSTVGLRFSKYLKLEGSVNYNIIDLPVDEGRFDSVTYGLTVQGATSRKLFANALLQYDNRSQIFRANLRINWIHTPGSDLFLVFNTSYRFNDQITFYEEALNTRLAVAKLTYLFQL